METVPNRLAAACIDIADVQAAYEAMLANRGVDLAARQGHTGWFLPVPATFVADGAGRVRWAFMDIDLTHRADPDDIVAALAAR